MTIDESLEGSESQKNKFLAPSPSVPKLDREVAEAHGIQLGLEKLTTEVNVNAASKKPLTEEERNIKKNESLKEEAMKNNPLYRPVSQDEMMGYDEDDYLMDSDDEEF